MIRRPSKNIPQKHTQQMQKVFKKVIQNEVPKSDLFDLFKGLASRVPQGGPRDPPRTPKVSPKVPKWSPKCKTESKGPPKCTESGKINCPKVFIMPESDHQGAEKHISANRHKQPTHQSTNQENKETNQQTTEQTN